MNRFSKLLISSTMVFSMCAPMTQVYAKTQTKTKVTTKAKSKTAIKLNATSKTLALNTRFTLKLSGTKTKAKWSASNGRVKLTKKTANSVVVTASKIGNVYVSAKIGKTYYSCYVKVVKKNASAIKVSNTKVNLAKGAYTTLTYSLKNQANLTISNNHKDIVSANLANDGKTLILNGLEEGTATLTLKESKTNTTATILVTVTSNAASLTVENELPSTFSTYTSSKLSAISTLSDVKITTSLADETTTLATISGQVKAESIGNDAQDNHIFINYTVKDHSGKAVKSGTIMLFNVVGGQTYSFSEKLTLSGEASYTILFSDYR